MQCVQQDPSTKAKTDADVGDARSQKTHRYVLPQGTVAILSLFQINLKFGVKHPDNSFF
jgi:hypothetical protein